MLSLIIILMYADWSYMKTRCESYFIIRSPWGLKRDGKPFPGLKMMKPQKKFVCKNILRGYFEYFTYVI